MNPTKAILAALLLGALALAGPVSALTATVGVPPGDSAAYAYLRAERQQHYAYECYAVDGEVWLENGRAPGLQRYGPDADRRLVGDWFHDMCFI